MRRAGLVPFVVLAALAAGIVHGAHAARAVATVALIIGPSLLAVSWFTHTRARAVLVVVAFALVGVGVSARAAEGVRVSPLQDAARRHTAVTLRGTLTTDPERGRFGATALLRVGLGHGRHRTVLVDARNDDAGRLGVLQAGDRVTVSGALAPLRTSSADARARVRHAVARLERADIVAVAPPAGVYAVADALRDRVIGGTAPLPPAKRALVAGFLLGDTREVPRDISAAYRDSGLTHLLAVSGENVAFVLALFGPLLRRMPLAARTTVACCVIAVFAAMTRFEPSVLRASAMAALALLAVSAGRPASRGRILAYAVIALLVIDPFLLRSVGFWMSCGASAGIAFAEPAIARRLPFPRAVREPLAVSLAAQLGVMPVLLVAFGDFPLVTPLSNLLAAPAAELLGVYGLFACAVSCFVPRLGPLVHAPTGGLVGWITSVARAGAAVPLKVDGRGLAGFVSVAAAIASVACLRARRAVPDPSPR